MIALNLGRKDHVHEELQQIAERVNRLSQEINTVALKIRESEQSLAGGAR